MQIARRLRTPFIVILVGIVSILPATPVDAAGFEGHFQSEEKQVALIELFTSEGCSSCPPADQWLSQQRNEPRIWVEYVPVGFHVDYWDYIGWKDRFARPEFSRRQRQYMQEGAVGVVYTPGFFQDGVEWRDWRLGEPPRSAGSNPGVLGLAIVGDQLAVQFAASETHGELVANVAILGMGITTDVRAGENNGRRLQHDFVVLGMISAPLDLTAAGYRTIAELPELVADAPSYAVAAWVSRADSQTPLQAVGGPLRETGP